MNDTKELNIIWEYVKSEVKRMNLFDDCIFDAFIETTTLNRIEDNVAYIHTLNSVANKIINLHNNSIEKILCEIMNQTFYIQFDDEVKDEEKPNECLFVFDKYLIGDFNRDCCNEVIRYLDEPISSKPLLIYANTGLGKTFLLKCIADYQNNQSVTSTFIDTNDFLSQVIKEDVIKILDDYMNCDLLLIDNIQNIKNKNLLEEIEKLCSKRTKQNKKTIITSDYMKKEFDQYFYNLFDVLKIKELDKQSALNMIHHINERRKYHLLMDKEVEEYISKQTNMRNIEGEINKITFKSIVYNNNHIDMNFINKYCENM